MEGIEKNKGITEKRSAIQHFIDIEAWKEGHLLVLSIYSQTKNFPKEEVFGLTSQIRRAAISITSNIAEGFGRETYRDKCHFYQIALGSLLETQNQILIAKDVAYISTVEFENLMVTARKVETILRGLIKKSRQLS